MKLLLLVKILLQCLAKAKRCRQLRLHDPHLWSPDAPYLYHAVSEIISNGKVIDRVTNSFGIRSIEITAD